MERNQSVPPILLSETPIPEFNGKTNEDLLDYILTLQYSLELCNNDKRAVHEIVERKNE